MSNTNYPEKFLKQFLKAMDHVDEIEDASTWKESKWDVPPLCKVAHGAAEVDEEDFKKFEKLVYFLTLGIFGTDDEGRGRGRLVKFYMKDTTRDSAALPWARVPRISFMDDTATLRGLYNARRSAQANASATQSLVEKFDKQIEMVLKDQFDREDFLERAKSCETCDGKGYTILTKKDCDTLDKDRYFKRSGPEPRRKYGIPYRGALCDECQPDNVV